MKRKLLNDLQLAGVVIQTAMINQIQLDQKVILIKISKYFDVLIFSGDFIIITIFQKANKQ